LYFNAHKCISVFNTVLNAKILRKYPPATILMRQFTSSYTFNGTKFNGTKINISKGQKVWIFVYAIHDPDIYPKPDVFDPERFNDKAV